MLSRYPDYYEDFHCLAGSCPDTCCGLWEIVVDEEAKKRYLAVEGALGEQIRNALTTVDGEDCMVLQNGKCPLLTEDGLCPIVTELGEDFLSTTCHTHPRFTEVYGGLQETALAVSCPEAARLLLTRQEPLTFVTKLDEILPEPTDLDADTLNTLMAARQTAFSLVQDRSRTLSDRLALLLCFARRIHDNLFCPQICEGLCRRYERRSYQDKILLRIRRKRRYGTVTAIRQLMNAMEHLGTEFPAALTELEHRVPDSIALEQLTVYFLYRWWLKAACNDDLYGYAAACIVSVLTVAGLPMETADAARLYSKEIEHSEENMALLRRAMALPAFTSDQLLKLLEVQNAI